VLYIIGTIIINIINIITDSNNITKKNERNFFGDLDMQKRKILKFFRKKYTVYELDLFGSVQDPEVGCHK
jgi:hypothetical protein